MIALFHDPVTEPGVPGDAGIRLKASFTGTVASTPHDRVFKDFPTPFPAVSGQTSRYLRRLRAVSGARGAAGAWVVGVDFTDSPAGAGGAGHDLANEANLSFALRHDQSGEVFGPFHLIDDADDGSVSDPYNIPWNKAEFDRFHTAAGIDADFTLIVYDRVVAAGGVLLAHAGDRLLAGAEGAAQRLRDALLIARGSYPAVRDYGSTIAAALDRPLHSAGAGALAAAVADAVAHPPNGLGDVRLRSVRAAADDGVVMLDVQADWVSQAGAITPIGLREQLAAAGSE